MSKSSMKGMCLVRCAEEHKWVILKIFLNEEECRVVDIESRKERAEVRVKYMYAIIWPIEEDL